MKKIENFGSIAGRELLRRIYKDLRYDKQRGAISSLFATWRLAVGNIEVQKYVGDDVQVLHSIGMLKGTSLWLEEIFNRFFFSTINSFVYFGAAILLVIVGIRRFSDSVSDRLVIYGIIFEAALLMLMFFIMLFTPNDEISDSDSSGETSQDQDEIISEIGEIGRDFATATLQLEEISAKISDMLVTQNETIERMNSIAESTIQMSLPNPNLIEIMRGTNAILSEFNDKIKLLMSAVEKIRAEEIRSAVRAELETILLAKYRDNEQQEK